MKVLAINSSPNGNYGSTASILIPFLDGLKENGAEVDYINLNELRIQPCRECTSDDFFNSNSKCRCDDDMQAVYPKLESADVWVFATPNYINSVNATMKNFLDRMEPLFQIDYSEMDALSFNSAKKPISNGKVILVSSCDLYESDNFNLINAQFDSVASIFSREFTASLLRPHAWAIKLLKQADKSPEDIFRMAKEAGKELASSGMISDDKLSGISRDLVPKESFLEELNKFSEIVKKKDN